MIERSKKPQTSLCKYVPKQVNVRPIQDRNLVHQVINQPDLFLSIKISAKKEKEKQKNN